METNKFKANPYNFNSHLITLNDITNIMEKLNINDFSTSNIKLYQNLLSISHIVNLKIMKNMKILEMDV